MSSFVYERYRLAFADALARALNAQPEEVDRAIKLAEPAHGDLAFAAFSFAKAQRKAPAAIASSTAQQLSVPGMGIAAAGPYVNARFAAMPLPPRSLSRRAPVGGTTVRANRGAERPW